MGHSTTQDLAATHKIATQRISSRWQVDKEVHWLIQWTLAVTIVCSLAASSRAMNSIQLSAMSGQRYKRTNFEEDETVSPGGTTPTGGPFSPVVVLKASSGFWHRRSLLECILFALVVILGIVIVTMAISRTHPSTTTVVKTVIKQQEQNLCTTPGCVSVAASILDSMDRSVDPCQDFYQFSCGGWIKSHPIPPGHSRWGTFGLLTNKNQLVLRHALEKPMLLSSSKTENKTKIYYQSCMDANKTIESLGARPLLDLLQQFGGWSISDRSGKWDSANWLLQGVIEVTHSYGLYTFFNFWVGEDEKIKDTNILQLDQGGLGLARDQYINKSVETDKVLGAYLDYMTTVGVLLGGNYNDTRRQMMDVIQFEKQLAELTTPQEDRRDDEKLYHKITIADLQKMAPFIDWLHYLNSLLNVTSYKKLELTEPIIVVAPGFMKNISTLLTTMLQNDSGKNVLNNYMKWHVAKSMCCCLSKPFTQARKTFAQVVTGIKGDEEQWRYCTSDVDSTLGFALGAMFVKQTFHSNSKQKAETMIAAIKDAFMSNLRTLDWMDPKTKAAALDKADAIIDKIGFPSFILNTTALDERYKDLDVKKNEYFLNNLRDQKYIMKRNLNKLRKKSDKNSWSMTPATVNAYYQPMKNEIVFPAGILQSPFYDQQYPQSLKFGSMGVVMGHELTHAFDDQGREYDKYGTLRQWWTNSSIEHFNKRTQCIVQQYSSYKIGTDNIRGKQTLGENIADNGGLKSAYHAYNKWIGQNGEETPLPGLNYTHQQLFFIAFSQVWCSHSTPEADHLSILTDPHSPPKFRVIGSLANSRDFSQQFKCKKGDTMYVKDKTCNVW